MKNDGLPAWCDKEAIRALMPSMVPATYRALVGMIGIPAFLEMCSAWGGRQHYFPTMEYVSRQGTVSLGCLSPGDRDVAAAIGLQAYLDLIEAYGGRYIYLPKLASLLRSVRDERIRKDYSTGLKVSDISDQYGITCTTVNSICKGLRAARDAAIGKIARL